MKLTLRENKNDLEFHPGQELNQEPLKTDMLIIEKYPDVEIKKTIGHIFRTHNIVEYKGVDDELNIDTIHKLIAYMALYKSQGENVNAIPATEITASICRNEYPQKLIEDLRDLGVTIKERYPGIYYITGLVYFPVQIVVFKRLNPVEYPELTMLKRNVTFEAVRTMQIMLTDCGYDCGEADGIFGNRTLSALKSFQSDHGLSVDGIYGPKSHAALTASYQSVR